MKKLVLLVVAFVAIAAIAWAQNVPQDVRVRGTVQVQVQPPQPQPQRGLPAWTLVVLAGGIVGGAVGWALGRRSRPDGRPTERVNRSAGAVLDLLGPESYLVWNADEPAGRFAGRAYHGVPSRPRSRPRRPQSPSA